MDIIIALSDACQISLNLTEWPARPLCNAFPDRDFPRWIGRNCTTPCIFGKPSTTDSEICECDKGYFGKNCSGICYGGAANTCNRHGQCDRKTGKCHCEINWRGSENCTKCSTGWTGSDCFFAITSPVESGRVTGVGGISSRGRLTTLSGLTFDIHLTGDYHLIYLPHGSLEVQVRIVSCYREFSCINAVGIRLVKHSVVIHGPYTSAGRPVIWVDNQELDIDRNPPTLELDGFSIIRVSSTLFEFASPLMSVILRIHGRYLALVIKVSPTVCTNSTGLLGDCSNDFLVSLQSFGSFFNCSKTESGTDDVESTPINSSIRHTDRATIQGLLLKTKVRACHRRILVNSYKSYKEFPEANSGYALFFRKSALISSTSIHKAFASNDIAIDFMIKVHHHGVILSYCKTNTFFITSLGGNLTIYFGYKVFHTNIKIEMNVWTQIALVYKKSSGYAQVYYFSSSGIIYRFDFRTQFDIFEPGGVIALAGWIPSLNGTGSQPPSSFTGLIDQMRIWNHHFHPAVIQQIRSREFLVKTKELKHTWRFDAGERLDAVDTTGNINMVMTTPPWRQPSWKYSDAVFDKPFYKKLPSYSFKNSSMQTKGEQFCSKLLMHTSLEEHCGELGKGVISFYYRSCLRKIALTGKLEMVVEVIIDFSDYCQSVLRLTTWPAQFLCNEFPGLDFPTWFGPACEEKCVYGQVNPQSVCVCDKGFWGRDCSRVCPGGASQPCSNRGVCNQKTGRCVCEVNWKGTPSCSGCSSGWTGRDCSITTSMVLPSANAVSVISGSGQHTSFDGNSFSFSYTGEFTLISNSVMQFELQVRQVPCNMHSVCVNAVALRVASTIISFHGPYTSSGNPVIWVNHHKILLNQLETIIRPYVHGVKISILSRHQYLLSWQESFKIYIRLQGRYLAARIALNTSTCANSTGILGSCDRNPNNDFDVLSILSNVTQKDINRLLMNKHRVDENSSLLQSDVGQHKETKVPNGALYALSFNNSGASTGQLIKSFPEHCDRTIEILFKPFKQGGTVLAYSFSKTFALSIDYTIMLNLGAYVINTGIAVSIGQWTHVSIVWHFKTKTLEIYHFDFHGGLQRRLYAFTENPFPSGGVLSIGQWELSSGDTEKVTEVAFCGIVDEVRIWKRAFDPVLIQQNFGMNVLPSDPGISALWKFNEGEGIVIHNLISEEHLRLPLKPWRQPIWVYSDANVRINSTLSNNPFYTVFPNTTLEKKAKSLCLYLFYQTQLFSSCKGLKAELEFYYMVCLQNVGATRNLGASLSSVLTFADHCQSTLDLSHWPARLLCNDIPEITFPEWIGDKCNVRCVFGKADYFDKNICKCDYGYWGKECDKTCPGGILHPCSDHGYCDSLSGTCKCDINWDGDVNCTSCSQGWYGSNCQYAFSPEIAKRNESVAVASVIGLGYYTTFTGISYTIRYKGEFFLLNSVSHNFAVQLRQGICIQRKKYYPLCTVGFAFTYNNVQIVIRAPLNAIPRQTTLKPLVWVNKRMVAVNHLTRLSTYFIMTRISTLTYSIRGPDGLKFELQVSNTLSVTCYIPRFLCTNSSGLLGSCLPSTGNVSNSSLVDKIVKALASQSAVQESESMFVYRYMKFKELRKLEGSGFNLVFKDSFVISKPLYLRNVEILTLEFLVKIHSYGGVIVSYARDNLFAIINEKTLKISYRGQEYTTGLTLEVQEWNQISVVFNQLLGTLKLYIFNSLGTVKIRAYKLDTEVWSDGGVLVFGQWQFTDNKSTPPNSSFLGVIDEIRFWNRRSNVDLVKDGWKLNVRPDLYKDLLHLWKLDQVEGGVVEDLVGGCHLSFKRFHEPQWGFSDSNMATPNLEQVNFPNNTFKQKAKSFCFTVILSGPLFKRCKSLGEEVAQFFYTRCLYETSISLDLQSAVYSVTSFADYCQATLKLKDWPGKELCNLFPEEKFPFWIGKQCETRCIFGYPVSSTNSTDGLRCKCEDGYWGENCQHLCPGGLENTCNGHGFCNAENGFCSCEAHWKGGENGTWDASDDALPCSNCSEGWTGTDCSIALTTNVSDSGLVINYGDPHFTTVTGASYNLETPGPFLLLKSTNITVQVLQVPCNDKVSCRRISELTLKTTTYTLSVKAIDLLTVETMLTTNEGKKEQSLPQSKRWTNLTTEESSFYRWPTPNILETTLPGGEKLNVLFYNGTLGTAIEIPHQRGSQSEGLSGASTGRWMADLQPEQASFNSSILTQSLIDTNLSAQARLSPEHNFLTGTYSKHHFNGAGFMLGFDDNHLSIDASGSFPALNEFTIELWVCLVNKKSNVYSLCSSMNTTQNTTHSPTTKKHALLSSSNGINDFALLYNGEVVVIWNDREIQTGLLIGNGEWTHLTITWRANDGRMKVLKSTSEANYTFVVYSVQMGGKLKLDGTLVIGKYLREAETSKDYNLRGALDELRVWQYDKTEEAVSKLKNVKFDYYMDGLVISIPFDQGFGKTVSAFVYNLKHDDPLDRIETNQSNFKILHLEANGEGPPPSWLPSGVQSTPITNYTLVFYNQSLKEEAFNICHNWFYSGTVQQLCSSRLVSQARFHFEACLADIADSGSISHYKLSISLFGFYCQKVLGIEECKLYGTYDAFPSCYKEGYDVDFPVVVVTITTVVIVATVVLCCCMICCCRKRRRRKRKQKKDSHIKETSAHRYAFGTAADQDEMELNSLGVGLQIKTEKNVNELHKGETNLVLTLQDDEEESETKV